MVVLGIDPGLAITGYAAIQEGSRLQLLTAGTIETARDWSLSWRLCVLYRDLSEMVQACHPDAVAIEELFFGRNSRTAISVGQARGVAILACAQAGLPIYQYKPAEVKEAVVGYGAAPKAQVQEMVRLLLQLPSWLQPDDVADAAAVALCHLRYQAAIAAGLVNQRAI